MTETHSKPKRGGPRPGSGRKSKAEKLLLAGFAAQWFDASLQKINWQKLLDSEDERIVLEAMKYLTDRVYGKAKQELEHTGNADKPIQALITLEFVSGTTEG